MDSTREDAAVMQSSGSADRFLIILATSLWTVSKSKKSSIKRPFKIRLLLSRAFRPCSHIRSNFLGSSSLFPT
jgi:hypothetical protein